MPGGLVAYPSSVLMNVIPAQVAGVILPGVSGSASGGALHIFGLAIG